jgi:hypothetical protein
MWLGLDLGLGLEYRVKIGVRVRARLVCMVGLDEYRVSSCFWMITVYPFIRCQRLGLYIYPTA